MRIITIFTVWIICIEVFLTASAQEPAQLSPRDKIIQEDIEKSVIEIIPKSTDILEIKEAKEELVSFGKKAVPVLVNQLKSTDPLIRYFACEILGDIRDDSDVVVNGLLEKLQDQEEYYGSIAFAAASALIKIGTDKAIPKFAEILEKGTKDIELLNECIRGLGRLRAIDHAHLISKYLNDKSVTRYDELIAATAVRALAKLRAQKYAYEIAQLLDDKETFDESSGQTLSEIAVKALNYINKENKKLEDWKKWREEERARREEERKNIEAVKITESRIAILKDAIEKFKKEQQKLPEKLQDLEKYTQPDNFKDGWNRDFQFKVEKEEFDIISFGADGIQGGEGYNQDVCLHGKNAHQK